MKNRHRFSEQLGLESAEVMDNSAVLYCALNKTYFHLKSPTYKTCF